MLNKIHNEDCLVGLQKLSNEFVDLTVTSPPYDNLRTYKGNVKFDFENIAKELYRVTKAGGVVVWIVGDATIKGSETGTSFKQALYFKETGFNLHDTMIYQKTGVTFPETNRYYPNFEYMFVLSKGKPKTVNLIADRPNKNAGGIITGRRRQADDTLKLTSGAKVGRRIKEVGIRYNVWQYSTGYMNSTADKIAFEHPAIFPEKLAADHIRSWSNEGDIVLDPFMGSGTTAKMAILLNRNFIGFELDAGYYDIANQRISLAVM